MLCLFVANVVCAEKSKQVKNTSVGVISKDEKDTVDKIAS